jgi:hypothetical protein
VPTAVSRIGENGLIVMAIMIRSEDNKDYNPHSAGYFEYFLFFIIQS